MTDNLDLRPEGRKMTSDEWVSRMNRMSADKIELVDGKFYDRESDRIELLSMLLEQVGVDKVVGLGDPEIWKDAVSRLD